MPPKRKTPKQRIVKAKRASERYPRATSTKPKNQKIVTRKQKTIPLIPIPDIRRDTCEKKYQEYKEGKEIGRGAFGRIYELCDSKQQCPFVLKTQYLHDHGDTYGDAMEQLTNEIRIQRLVYDKLKLAPKIYDTWICDPDTFKKAIVFIVMERMDGDLSFYVKHHSPFTQEGLDKLNKTLKSHFSKLQKLGINHGDLKLSNLLYKTIGKDIRIVFGDFGLSRLRGVQYSDAYIDALGENDHDRFENIFLTDNYLKWKPDTLDMISSNEPRYMRK